MDRVKAAIFSSLGEAILHARVLDLFSGTGALGIEALSRGAAMVLFVEENSAATAAIEKNLARTNLKADIRQQDVFAFLQSGMARERFDIIFADPPYEQSKSGGAFTQLLLGNARIIELLEEGGTFVLEKRPGEQIPASALWKTVRAKRYGATEVLFLQSAAVPGAH